MTSMADVASCMHADWLMLEDNKLQYVASV
jgi:hypothetical protein